jgi:hypothetical protein
MRIERLQIRQLDGFEQQFRNSRIEYSLRRRPV